MSIEIIQKQIERFLASETPEVMSIKGAWGVGKTYAWNSYLNAARNNSRIALPRYSYVSLFGINSLEDLKYAIFENMVAGRAIGRKPGVDSFKLNIAQLLKTFGKRSFSLTATGNRLDHFRPLLRSLAFLSLEKMVICIDDFERKGRDVEAQDILGLISQLKEQKKCKVVLILNDENMAEGSSGDYLRLKEKVIDTELKFMPTAQDCHRIALSRGQVGSLLGENIGKLRINNIRIIKKIEALSRQLTPILKKYNEQVLRQALRTLTLLTWCYYSHSSNVPEYSFVLGRIGSFGNPDEDVQLTTQQQSWCALLRQYDNFVVDEFDLQIAALVENGYLDEVRMLEQADILQERIQAVRSENSFQEAWRRFNNSFEDDEQEVISCLAESFKNSAKYITPVNLDGAVRLLRYLGKSKQATKIIDLYIEKRQDEVELFNLAGATLSGEIKDAEIVEKFGLTFERLRGDRSLLQLCQRLVNSDEMGEEDEHFLAAASVAEFVQLFKEQRGAELARCIDFCLKFGRLGGTTEAQRKIFDKSSEALKIIGRETKMNASRVKRFGVEGV